MNNSRELKWREHEDELIDNSYDFQAADSEKRQVCRLTEREREGVRGRRWWGWHM